MMNKKISSGFTLIEMAIVMVIIGVLIGAAILPLKAQRDTAHIKQARNELKTIEEAIYGFAIANGRLPCPAQPGSAVEDLPGGGNCTNTSRGFVPANTLGLSGNTNCDSLLIDPWGNPYRYSVTASNHATLGDAALFDFTTSDEIKDIKIAAGDLSALNPNLDICDVDNCGSNLTSVAVAAVYSMGKRWRNVTSAGEIQNAGEGAPIASTCGLAAYGMSNNNQYVFHSPVEIVANQFDDIMIWISPNILYAKLLAAGQL